MKSKTIAIRLKLKNDAPRKKLVAKVIKIFKAF